MEHLSLKTLTLTALPHKNPAAEHCLVGSLTGEVDSKRVTESYKGWLSADGNRAGRTKAKASLTARRTCRAGSKDGLSDPRMRSGCAAGLTDKSYPGDTFCVLSRCKSGRENTANNGGALYRERFRFIFFLS